MAKITSQSIEKVRDTADIAEVIGSRTDLRRQGSRLTGLCPFHDERTPSFSVNPEEKLYYCFGCEASGDVFTFVQETEGLGFVESVEWLAERFGVEIERDAEDPREQEARRRRERISDLLERAARYYQGYLWNSPKAERARRYLSERGLEEQVLREFGVGLSPSDWGSLMKRAQLAGFTIEELEAAGLIRKGRSGGYYDAFKSRIVFPIRDRRGRVIGFGARATRDEQRPKYVNSAETSMFRKSEVVYGIDLARAAIAKAGRAVIAEGYTDVITLHQAGFRESVGVMGTAITDRQVATVATVTDELVLGLDADRAGREAMLRAQRIARERNLKLRIASLPAGRDPADILAEEGGPARLTEILDGAVGVEEFQVELILAEADRSSPESRDEALDRLAPVLGQMPEGAVRGELERRAAERLDLDPGLITRRATGAALPQGGPVADHEAARSGEEGSEPRSAAKNERRVPATVTPRERHERALLAMCIEEPRAGRDILARLTPEHVSSPTVWKTVEWLRDHLETPLKGITRDDEPISNLVRALVMQATPPQPESVGSGYEPASAEAMEVNFMILDKRRLERAISAAGDRGDHELRSRLIRERAGLAQRLTGLGAGIALGAPGTDEAAREDR